MDLAGRGLPAGGPAGYEILDSLSGFGTTSQMFDAAYWRAKEGELARTITGSPDVRSARVHLANPVAQPFSRTPAGSASVTVTLARGTLDAAQAEAIRYLVSSAVAGIAPEGVAVIDSARGVVLAGASGTLGKSGLTDPNDRAETLRGNIQRLLEARVGPGRAIVEVNVDADMDSQTITERVIDPDSRVAISSETEESSENSQGGNSGVTVARNLPDGDVEGGAAQTSRQSSETRERQNFEVSETRRERVILPGQVRRVSVAVMVDGLIAPGADGAETWTPRPAEELETLRHLVQSAIGFDESRGDTVTIETLQFTIPADQGSVAERVGDGFLATHGARLIQVGVLGAIVLALILFVLRPMVGRRPALDLAELTGPREHGGDPIRQLGSGASHLGDILDVPPQTVTKIERLREVISNRSEDSAAVLRSWIEAPDSRKEPAGS
jgi:flagellar M-ring protein FliF